MKKERREKNAGYMTVEAVFVFCSILIILFAIIYSFFLLYQNVVLLNAATVGAQEAAYRIASSQTEDLDVTDIVDNELKKGLFKASDTTKEVQLYGVLQPTVKVTLKYKINFPLRHLAEMIAGNEVLTYTVSSTARVCDRPDYIRKINLIKEAGTRLTSTISDFVWGTVGGLLKK